MKYKVGDKVRIKSLDWYKEQDGLIPSWLCPCCGRVMTITVAYIQGYAVEEVQGVLFKDFMIEGLVEEEVGLVDKLSSRWVNEFNLPDGYIFKDENGNVINATKIVLEKKKKEYPKTFEECVHVLEGDSRMSLEQMNTFRRLIDARNAYWKIAGEEMGLGKPWKPDYDSGADKFGIICLDGVVQESNSTTNWERHLNKILDFPTRAMRDAFKENFDPDIEICKEFL